MTTELTYDRETGNLEIIIRPSAAAEYAIFSALEETKVKPTLISKQAGGGYNSINLRFRLQPSEKNAARQRGKGKTRI